MHLVEMAALLHDVQDWKYSHSESASRASVQVMQCRLAQRNCHGSWTEEVLMLRISVMS